MSTEDERRRWSLDPTSWHGALVVMLAATAVLWIVQIANAANDYSFDRTVGLRPRQVDGLWGIVTEPFLHTSYGHLFSNTAPFVLVGWVLMLSGLRAWLTVTGIVIVAGGALTWLIAPSGIVVGASGLVFGWLGYLLARAYFSRRFTWIVTAIAVLFFFGTFLAHLIPSFDSSSSWEANVAGFAAGILAGAVLHPRQPRSTKEPREQRPAVS